VNDTISPFNLAVTYLVLIAFCLFVPWGLGQALVASRNPFVGYFAGLSLIVGLLGLVLLLVTVADSLVNTAISRNLWP
jgi:hypothetical protein